MNFVQGREGLASPLMFLSSCTFMYNGLLSKSFSLFRYFFAFQPKNILNKNKQEHKQVANQCWASVNVAVIILS